ncbi:hypothetical protein BKA61DRAFT_580385 [Leptodontidium sp. MPI-SDFR-AT-0119]|nr:hypothetical protein BKA61DRAFT_580385 [Leptodontidium sp. MPI-SDFR-AT-0119]
MTADLFCHVFKSTQEAVALSKDAQTGDNAKAHEAAAIQREKAERVEQLTKEFASNVPELKFSPAEIFSFLMGHRKSPDEAISNVEKLISKPIEAKSKPPKISEDAKPEHTLTQPTVPSSSPNLSPSKCPVALSDDQGLVKSVMDMQMPSAHAPRCTCSYTPPKDPLEATSTYLCSLTPCHTFLTNQLSGQIVTTKHV